MGNGSQMMCRMYLNKKQYMELSEEGKKLYMTDGSGVYTEFPAMIADGFTLGDCVTAIVETAYLELNPKYQISESTRVKCEQYKLGSTQEVFNLLITIQYEQEQYKDDHNELLMFQERELTEDKFAFELVGDQTMFQMNY